MTMNFPKTRVQQATSVYAQQATPQQTGINISDTLNLMLPVMVVGLMAKAMGKAKPSASGKTGKATAKSTSSQST